MLTFYQICSQCKAGYGNCILTIYVRISLPFEVPQTSALVMSSGRFYHYSRPAVRPTGSKGLFVDDNRTGPFELSLYLHPQPTLYHSVIHGVVLSAER